MTSSLMFNRVIVSADDSPQFLNFWPIVSKAWQKYFNVSPTLAFVSDRREDDNVVNRLRLHGEVYIFPTVKGIPIQNLAKVSRFLLASRFLEDVSMIEDIDTIPLQSSFINERLSHRKSGEILAVGHEVYAGSPHEGKFPVSNITSEGYNFFRLFNPLNLGFRDCVLSYAGLRIYDSKEDISNHPDLFSDESLIRALITRNNISSLIKKVDRNVDIKRDWIDRSWWSIDETKLINDGYVCCNFLRPFKENMTKFEPIIRHVCGGAIPNHDDMLIL